MKPEERSRRSDGEFLIGEVIWDEELRKQGRIRRKKCIFRNVAPVEVQTHIRAGWEHHRALKHSIRLRKKKDAGMLFEDKIWCTLQQMGFTEMNKDRSFSIKVDSKETGIPPKQIDVFAKHEMHVIVAECKTSEILKKRALHKDIHEIDALQKPITEAIQKHYGVGKREIKTSFVFATRNIQWTEGDLARADAAGIHVVTDQNMEYYRKLAQHIGPASIYQFLAYLLKKTRIRGLSEQVRAMRGKMGGMIFYLFAIQPAKLLRIAYIPHRVGPENTVGAYQRMLDKKRLLEINKFISDRGIFPTNVIVNFRTRRKLKFDAEVTDEGGEGIYGTLHLPNTYGSALIVDGQHRLYGFSGNEWASKEYIPVIAFEGMSPSTQARMFVDINKEQVSVPANLLWDLYPDIYADSDDPKELLNATIAQVVKELNRRDSSPLRDYIKMPRVPARLQKPNITMQALCNAIKSSRLIGYEENKKFKEGPFSKDNFDETVNNSVCRIEVSFRVIATELRDQWDKGHSYGGYVRSNNGIVALMIVLRELINYINYKGNAKLYEKDDLADFRKEMFRLLKPIIDKFKALTPEKMEKMRGNRGVAGQKEEANRMMSWIREVHTDFLPRCLEEWEKARPIADDREHPYFLIGEIVTCLGNFVRRRLQEAYGPSERGWWVKGVPQRLRAELARRREEDTGRHDPLTYAYLMDFREVLATNWDHFKDIFATDPHQKKDRQLAWIVKLNDCRRTVMHPQRGSLTDDQVAFVRQIHQWVIPKIQSALETTCEQRDTA